MKGWPIGPWPRDPPDLAKWPVRWVKLMPDIDAGGVWDHEGAGCTCDSLPISNALVGRIRTWQQEYDTADDDAWQAGVFPCERWRGFDWAAFQAEAEAIAAELRAELPGWQIVCFDTLASRDYPLRESP